LNPREPQQFSRRALLVISGMSPQILTETLYGLIHTQAAPFWPTEIHMVTTQGGARNAQRYLLHPDHGHFRHFCREYGLDDQVFSEGAIRVIVDRHGRPLEDIRTPAENEAAADFITDIVRELTSDNDLSLHVSMAGGRKTMGYYAGYALSLFGRPQDRLSHVLVSEPYEQLRNFYFPTRESHLFDTPNGKVLDARDAVVTLAEIPFVRLRDEVPQALLAGTAGFSETIHQAQRLNEPESLVIDIRRKCILASGQEIRLPPLLFAFYAWIIRRQLDGQPEPASRDLAAANAEYAEALLALFERIEGEMGRDLERTRRGLNGGMEKGWFEEKKSRVNELLRQQLGRSLAERYQIDSFGKRGYTRHGLRLAAEQIEWLE